MAKNKKTNQRRSNHEGSIYFREDKGLWCASIQIGYDENGKRIRKTFYSKLKEELLEKKKLFEAELVKGTYTDSGKTTLENFILNWLNTCCKSSLRPSTYRRYEGIVRQHIIPSIGKLLISKITPLHVQNLYNIKIQNGLTPSSVRYIHAVLHKALSQALKMGLVYRNVADAVDKPKQIKKEMKIWTKEEVEKFLSIARDNKHYTIFLFALCTGMRQGEIMGLQWNDIDLEKEVLHVKRSLSEVGGKLIIGEPKTNSSKRLISLPKILITELLRHKEKQIQKGFIDVKWVFCDSNGNPLRASNIVNRYFKPMIKKAGLSNIRFHDQRHIHSTLLLEQGVNPKLVQERLGHSTITLTLNTYSHVLPNMQKQVAKELDVIFGR